MTCSWRLKVDKLAFQDFRKMHLVKSNLCQTTVVSLWLVIPRPFSLSRETPSSFNCSVTAWFYIAITINLVIIINICAVVKSYIDTDLVLKTITIRIAESYLDANLDWFKEFQRVLFNPAETAQHQEHVLTKVQIGDGNVTSRGETAAWPPVGVVQPLHHFQLQKP